MKRKVLWVTAAAGVVVALAGLGLFGYREAMKRGWMRFNAYDIRSEGILQVGDRAPDLALSRADGQGAMQLSELYRSRPVVLVFGSYT